MRNIYHIPCSLFLKKIGIILKSLSDFLSDYCELTKQEKARAFMSLHKEIAEA